MTDVKGSIAITRGVRASMISFSTSKVLWWVTVGKKTLKELIHVFRVT